MIEALPWRRSLTCWVPCHRGSSRDQLERGHMTGLDDGEVTPVEGGDCIDLQWLSNGDDRGADRSETEVSVPLNQIDHTGPILGSQVDSGQFALLDRP